MLPEKLLTKNTCILPDKECALIAPECIACCSGVSVVQPSPVISRSVLPPNQLFVVSSDSSGGCFPATNLMQQSLKISFAVSSSELVLSVAPCKRTKSIFTSFTPCLHSGGFLT